MHLPHNQDVLRSITRQSAPLFLVLGVSEGLCPISGLCACEASTILRDPITCEQTQSVRVLPSYCKYYMVLYTHYTETPKHQPDFIYIFISFYYLTSWSCTTILINSQCNSESLFTPLPAS